MEWLLFVIVAIMIFLVVFISWFYWFAGNQKIYQVTWRYDNFCTSTTTELIKAKDPGDAWRKVKRQHAFYIDLVEVKEYV